MARWWSSASDDYVRSAKGIVFKIRTSGAAFDESIIREESRKDLLVQFFVERAVGERTVAEQLS
eukprot:2701573-Heterocapsa_arctica.AAC.1